MPCWTTGSSARWPAGPRCWVSGGRSWSSASCCAGAPTSTSCAAGCPGCRHAAGGTAAHARGVRRGAAGGDRPVDVVRADRRGRGAPPDRDVHRPLGRRVDRQPAAAGTARRRLPDVGRPAVRPAGPGAGGPAGGGVLPLPRRRRAGAGLVAGHRVGPRAAVPRRPGPRPDPGRRVERPGAHRGVDRRPAARRGGAVARGPGGRRHPGRGGVLGSGSGPACSPRAGGVALSRAATPTPGAAGRTPAASSTRP